MIVVRSRFVVLEGIVVAVIDAGASGCPQQSGRRRKVAIEPSPTYTGGIEQIADVLPGHHYHRGSTAIVPARRDIRNHRSVYYLARDRWSVGLMSLSRDQIQMSHDRCAERSGEEIIAHRKVLSVVPQGSYGVAVVISHGEIRSAPGSGRTERLRHFVDEPIVIGGLFIGVVIVIVASEKLTAIKSKWRRRIRIVLLKPGSQSIHTRSLGGRGKRGLAFWIQCVRVSAEVVIEGDILIEN